MGRAREIKSTKQISHTASGETFVHYDRTDGKRSLHIEPSHGHVVLNPNGIPAFVREGRDRIIADDRLP